jgi:ABC-type nitrate/sulfonate/bicarbonate transport system permease component
MMGRPARTESLTALALVASAVLAWEMTVRWLGIPVYLLPAPSRVLATLFTHGDLYLEATGVTLLEAMTGLLLGALAGCLGALVLGLFPRLERGVMTLAILIKSTPLVAIAPLLTIWLGFGILPKILITALLTFFPVLVNVLSGLRAVDPALLDTLRSWHADRWELLRHVRMPNALPHLFAALKVSAPLSLIGAVVAEWTGASGGLGRTMWLAYTNLNLPFLFAAVFVLGALGIALYSLVSSLERKFVFWSGE